MTERQTIVVLILIIALSWLGFGQLDEAQTKEIESLQNRIAILEEIIKNYEVIEVLNDKIEVVAVKQAAVDENEWIQWISDNRWILGIEWGE
jgi:PII-like signaling protein